MFFILFNLFEKNRKYIDLSFSSASYDFSHETKVIVKKYE